METPLAISQYCQKYRLRDDSVFAGRSEAMLHSQVICVAYPKPPREAMQRPYYHNKCVYAATVYNKRIETLHFTNIYSVNSFNWSRVIVHLTLNAMQMYNITIFYSTNHE